ncbi:hypothetical protein KXV85_004358, partial [Aspergillus fumigatus]
PAAGLNPSETADLSRLLSEIAADGRAVLLVEHDMGMVMSISSHIVVVNFGRKLAEGTPKDIASNKDVIAAYLGADEAAGYGPVEVLHGISIAIRKGEIFSIVGANGAGKSTLLNTISGFNPIRSGAIVFDGRPIAGTAPAMIARAGLRHVPEGRRVFAEMTVEENL